MELQKIAQLNDSDGLAEAANTGKKGLLVELATPEHLIMMPKQFVIPKDTDFNLAYITTKVEDGTFTPIIGASSFEDVSADDSYNTNSSGVKRLNLKGLIEHRYTFEEGHEFYKQLSKLESFKSYSFAMGDDEGNWSMAKNSAGDYIGFTATHVTPERRKSKVKGGDNEMKSMVIQFDDRKQWDINYDVFLAEYLDFNPEEIPAINGVNTSIFTVPVATDGSIDAEVVLSADHSTPVEGLVVGNFVVEVDGVAATISTVTELTPGRYEIAISPALTTGDVIKVSLNGVVNQSGVLYRSNNFITETVA